MSEFPLCQRCDLPVEFDPEDYDPESVPGPNSIMWHANCTEAKHKAALAAGREEGRRQGWADAIAALRGKAAAIEALGPQYTGVMYEGVAEYLADQAPKEE